MKNTQKLSNSFLVYNVVFLSVLVYIFGIFAVVHFIKESSQIGFVEAFSENIISVSLGIISLFLILPIYRFTKSLRILDLIDQENGASFLRLYSPFFISDMPQADSKIIIQNINGVSQNNYFGRLVELSFEENGTERIIKSFVSPESLQRLKNT
ncbi:hypothetical protein [Fodinibius sp. Rm-B-1B1-1]|uniref:hypothetical protein n=1 Tax=Fodinibius alkaliphilus TaxID=3140241 RepID=UPI00315A5489